MGIDIRSAIYRFVSPSGRCYVGSAVDYPKRRRDHLHLLRKGRHHSLKLQNAWNKYGEQLVFELLELVPDLSKLVSREQYHMDALDVYRSGYNMAPLAGSTLGRRHSEETKQQLREINLRPEYRAAHSAVHKGKTVSAETREKQARVKVGRPWKEERKIPHREALARYWASPAGIEQKRINSERARRQWEARCAGH
jgi:group I intron endonuclease